MRKRGPPARGHEPQSPYWVAVSYEKLKLISTLKSIGVGSPSRTVGCYLLFETALNAAEISIGCPLIARIPVTLPCSSMTASMTTTPDRWASLARAGYSGSGPKSRRGGFTLPPTRTGTFGPSATGISGGGTPFKTPPRTPPTWPPGTPPGTPINASSGGAPALPGVATIDFGMNVGAVSCPGVKTRTGAMRAGRSAAEGISGAGGGAARGGG